MYDKLAKAWNNLRTLMSESNMDRVAWETNLAVIVSLQPRVELTDEQRYARYLETGR